MGGGGKGKTTQSTSQTSEPPSWAKPLLQKAAGEAMNLYNSGQGYNVYRGPTQAQFSDPRLEGLNRAMMMSGSTGPKITNESVFNNPAIQGARAQIAQQQAQESARKLAAAQAAAAAAAQKKPTSGNYWVANRGGGKETFQSFGDFARMLQGAKRVEGGSGGGNRYGSS